MPFARPRTFLHADFPPDALAQLKAAANQAAVDGSGHTTISVCLPARNEGSTVGPIVEAVREELIDAHDVIDEIIVVDDHSTDDTAVRARAAGARVVDAQRVLADYGEGHGKGEALWKSLFVAEGDIVVWCDADIVNFETRFVRGLVGPLLLHPDIAFVKGYYERPSDGATGGGRVTELVARPIISLLFPHLAGIVQPLAGEYAGRREVLERLPFVQGYGVEIGLLIDVAAAVGVDAMAQVDLGTRIHRNRPLDELSPQAIAVLATALQRAGHGGPDGSVELVRPGAEPVVVDVGERPPLLDVATYRRNTA